MRDDEIREIEMRWWKMIRDERKEKEKRDNIERDERERERRDIWTERDQLPLVKSE
jgi:hypothetical protein